MLVGLHSILMLATLSVILSVSLLTLSVCLYVSVCLSLHLHISETIKLNFSKRFVPVACDCGLIICHLSVTMWVEPS